MSLWIFDMQSQAQPRKKNQRKGKKLKEMKWWKIKGKWWKKNILIEKKYFICWKIHCEKRKKNMSEQKSMSKNMSKKHERTKEPTTEEMHVKNNIIRNDSFRLKIIWSNEYDFFGACAFCSLLESNIYTVTSDENVSRNGAYCVVDQVKEKRECRVNHLMNSAQMLHLTNY